MYRPRTKPQTGKRARKSAGRAYCRNHPGDPSCYYPGKNNQYINTITGLPVDSGCIGGNRNALGNPQDCDFRKVKYKGDNPTQLTDSSNALGHFNRARVEYANSQVLIQKYTPFELDASGWPAIPTLTENRCQNPTNHLIDQLNAQIIPQLWNAGVRIWVSQRGTRRLACTRGMPRLRYPTGVVNNNRYFQMGINFARTAAEHLWQAFVQVYNSNLATDIDSDEAAALAYIVENNLTLTSPIRPWRNALKLLKVRHQKATEDEVQAAAAAAVAMAPPQEILDLDEEVWAALLEDAA